MKLVLAYLPPEHLNGIIDALSEHHVSGLTVSDAKGLSQEHDPVHPERPDRLGITMTRKVRLEFACHDQEVDAILEAVYQIAHSSLRGAGKVFVLPVHDALRLRTGERGLSALDTQTPGHSGGSQP